MPVAIDLRRIISEKKSCQLIRRIMPENQSGGFGIIRRTSRHYSTKAIEIVLVDFRRVMPVASSNNAGWFVE